MLKNCSYLLLLVFLFACTQQKEEVEENSSIITKQENEGKVLRIGSISKSFLNIEDQFKPFEMYMIDQISEFGYTSTKTVLTSSLKELEAKINQGEVDLYSGSLYSTIYFDVKTDLEPVLKRAISDEYTVKTVLFTNKNSNINKLKDLLGKVVVFEHEYSTSGYYYPKTLLLKKGFNLVKVDNPKQKVDKNSIGFCFSNSDENSVAWVVNGYAAAAATDITSFNHYSGAKVNDLVLLHKSKGFLRYIVSFNKNLSAKLRDRLARVFIDYPEVAVKDTLLKKYYEMVDFNYIDGEEYSVVKKDLEEYMLD